MIQIQIPDGAAITVEVDGKKVAAVQKLTIRCVQKRSTVEAFGQVDPVQSVAGGMQYELVLSRLQVQGNGLLPEVDFFGQKGFDVLVAKPGSKVVYTGCEWNEIEQSASLGGEEVEQVRFTASGRVVLYAE